jgi:hypothetical protein
MSIISQEWDLVLIAEGDWTGVDRVELGSPYRSSFRRSGSYPNARAPRPKEVEPKGPKIPFWEMSECLVTQIAVARIFSARLPRPIAVHVVSFELSIKYATEHEDSCLTAHAGPSESCPENGDRTTPPETLGAFKTALHHSKKLFVH